MQYKIVNELKHTLTILDLSRSAYLAYSAMHMRRRSVKKSYLGLQPIGQAGNFGRVTPQLKQLLRLRQQWPAIVGPSLSQKICPLKISGDVLTVLTPHNGWAYQLTMMQTEIITKVQAQTGIALTQVKWQVGALPEAQAGPEKPRGQKCSTQHRTSPSQDQSVMDVVARVRKLHQKLVQS